MIFIPLKNGIQENFGYERASLVTKHLEGMSSYYVYILASKRNGTLYIGFTKDLVKRVFEHKNNLVGGFTKKYRVHNLVYFEETSDVESARLREKQIKEWKRAWKIELIEKSNPGWEYLYERIL